jgi:hypothetical protein
LQSREKNHKTADFGVVLEVLSGRNAIRKARCKTSFYQRKYTGCATTFSTRYHWRGVFADVRKVDL